MPNYVIDRSTNQVFRHKNKTPAKNHVASLGDNGVLVSSADDLVNLDSKLLVGLYNVAAEKGEGKTITRFPSKEAAASRTWPAIDFLAEEGPTVEAPARATPAAGAARKTATPRAEGEEGAEGNGIGRAPALAGKNIFKTDTEPKGVRETSLRGVAYAAIPAGGISYENLLQKGIRSGEISYLVRRGFAEAREA